MYKVDLQTHKDIVGLIEVELEVVAHTSYANSAERLACVIEGRLGQETPKGDWHFSAAGDAILRSDTNHCLVRRVLATPAEMRMMTAAPDVIDAGCLVAKLYLETKGLVEAAHPGVGLSKHLWGEKEEYENLVKALLKAGVDI